MEELIKNFLEKLSEKKLTVAFAESVTCGLACNELNLVEGTSKVLMGGIVCYNEKVKIELLKVDPQLIEKHTAESQEVTDALAKSLPTLISADVHVAITGLNADGGSESPSKPVGTVFFSLFYKGKLQQRRRVFKGSPQEIKKQAVEESYKMILEEIEK